MNFFLPSLIRDELFNDIDVMNQVQNECFQLQLQHRILHFRVGERLQLFLQLFLQSMQIPTSIQCLLAVRAEANFLGQTEHLRGVFGWGWVGVSDSLDSEKFQSVPHLVG